MVVKQAVWLPGSVKEGEVNMDHIHRWEKIKDRIKKACYRVGRDPNDVNVVVVTKYIGSDQIRCFFDLGLNHVGESRVKDAVAKWQDLYGQGIWHFIGSLQRRKVKEVIGRFTYLHSLDRYALASEIDKYLKQEGGTLRCFIQVNVSGEKTKHGIFPNELKEFVQEIANLSTIEVVGLMTIAPIVDKEKETRCVFRQLKQLQQQLQPLNLPRLSVRHLSMGMSQDFEVAIEEGATWIRLGSVLVGKG